MLKFLQICSHCVPAEVEVKKNRFHKNGAAGAPGQMRQRQFVTLILKLTPFDWFYNYYLTCICLECSTRTVWPDLAIFCTLGNFLKALATIILLKSSTVLSIFVKVSKSIIFLLKSFLGNFYRHLAIFFWSHCTRMSLYNLCISIALWFFMK